ncbi:amidase signature domain-containing protein [Aspergillus cavernicola]|uniref:Amidase signature domain-containing protein n=1 Tax=Aspergillus cavernicola TaxID=176166 RepID=A0ABR4J878_9EURO
MTLGLVPVLLAGPCLMVCFKDLGFIRFIISNNPALSLLSRMESRDSTVQAWAHQLEKVPAHHRGPLHGIPIDVKDVIYTRVMPTEHNFPLYKDSLISVDAASVAILRAAGALIFSLSLSLPSPILIQSRKKTITTAFAAMVVGPSTTNPTIKRAHLSTIRPGLFIGEYALNPTWGAVSREGQKVSSLTLDTLGVFGRSVADLQLMAGFLGVKDDAGTVAALKTARALLEKSGAVVKDVTLPSAFDSMPGWHAKIMAADGRVAFLSEYQRDKMKIQDTLVGQVENIVNRYTALLMPSVPDEATAGLGSTGSAAFNWIWTIGFTFPIYCTKYD